LISYLSGCITSAESVLITLQSHNEVSSFLSSNAAADAASRKVAVISIAPQSLASLAASVSSSSPSPVTPRQMLHRLKALCKEGLGFAHVFDTTFARHVALKEHVEEFMERQEKHVSGLDNEGSKALPMLASACPGWICYAEKAHPEMLPFIANTKSPQQVMGTLVKNWMGAKWGKRFVVCIH
jgi:iron only hydrogenase large subunit-like protein